MRTLDWLLGTPIATSEAEKQRIGPLAGIPILGLDAFSSAAYGPEAALTLLLPLGVTGLLYVGPIMALIALILLIVYFSYRQTIAAYPLGGGSYSVARENLGPKAALLAGAALALDYILNVAVGISAGVGALVSAVPSLLPHTLKLCLAILALLTLINLRGVKESGLAFMLPTYLFVATLGGIIVIGFAKTVLADGHPAPVEPPPALPIGTEAVGAWILLRAFASGCTAMTGVEAVSNGVPLFKNPPTVNAQRTLGMIVAILVALLAGIAGLSRAYGVVATPPGETGYQSVLSMLTGAVVGRGSFYYLTMAAVVAVLALSANTSFADFPRLCRVLAEDRYLPGAFVRRGRRLVFSNGIILLAACAAALLIAFGGITDRLIPLFAIGAFLAFTLSQAGMVAHWRRTPSPHARRSMIINAVGATSTGITLLIVAVSKFADGAWITVVVVPLMVIAFSRVNRHYRRIAGQLETIEPLAVPLPRSPIIVVPANSWNKMMKHALDFALRLSSEIYVVQIKTERDSIEDLSDNWELLIGAPAKERGVPEPRLVVLESDVRRFYIPFVDFVFALELSNPDRDIVVVIPELVMTHWWAALLHNNRGMLMRTLLRMQCGPRVFIVDAPYRLHK